MLELLRDDVMVCHYLKTEVYSQRRAVHSREWEFHKLMLGAKDQVRAQFGKDSNEVQAIGLKRKSEYSRPKSRAKKESAPA